MEWSIQQIARLAGTTSRTLRHYGELGLVPPSRVGSNGYRYYNGAALVRLQRVLLLRELGLGLTQIGEVLSRERDEAAALTSHLGLLREQQLQLARQIAAVEHSIDALSGRERLMPEHMFDGFDHTRYREEVEERWGADAYARSDHWWRGLDTQQRADWQRQVRELNSEWIAAASESGASPGSGTAQQLAARHIDWLRAIPGTPAGDGGDLHCYVRGLVEMYVADERFAANYGGAEGARFVRNALIRFLDRAAA